MREELTRLLTARRLSLLDDWSHEVPDDPDGDADLLAEALAQIEWERDTPLSHIDCETARAELARAEAAGALPDQAARRWLISKRFQRMFGRRRFTSASSPV